MYKSEVCGVKTKETGKKTFIKSLKKNGKQYLGYGVALLIGLVGGGLIGLPLGELIAQSESLEELFPAMLVCFGGLYLGFFLQIALHEAGHLLAGLMSGYRFVSYRIMSFMWVKQEGRIRLRRYALAGTAGQCLMAPPDLVDGKIPVMLYNLGGSIMNLMAGLLFGALWYACRSLPYAAMFFQTVTLMGAITALSNGIPLRLGAVDNDGYNAFSLGKNPAALRAFWIQLKVNELQMQGMCLKDMPEEWFTLPDKADRKNTMVTATAVMAANRLLDEGRFEESDALMQRLESDGYNIVGVYRSLMACDRLYLELIGENRREAVEALYTPALKKFMKAMKAFPSVLRTRYALALIQDRDAIQAGKLCAAFDRMAAHSPEQGTIESERALMALADERAAARNQ